MKLNSYLEVRSEKIEVEIPSVSHLDGQLPLVRLISLPTTASKFFSLEVYYLGIRSLKFNSGFIGCFPDNIDKKLYKLGRAFCVFFGCQFFLIGLGKLCDLF